MKVVDTGLSGQKEHFPWALKADISAADGETKKKIERKKAEKSEMGETS